MGTILYEQIMKAATYADLPSTAGNGQLAIDLSAMMTYQFNASLSVWQPIGRPNIKKSMVTVNGKTVGPAKILTLEQSPLNFYPALIIPRAVNISGVTTPPTVSLGANSTSYNNIASASLLSTLLSALSAGDGAPSPAQYSPGLPGGMDIYANVSVPAVATNYGVSYDILGYYY